MWLASVQNTRNGVFTRRMAAVTAVYLVDATPEECLNAVTAYLLGRDFDIENRLANSVTLKRKTGTMSASACLVHVILLIATGGAWAGWLIAGYFLGAYTWTATAMATPEPDGRTRLTVIGSKKKVEKLLEAWVYEAYGERAVRV
jgi:hypothetical protein